MSTSSKSPRKVALAALAVGKDALPLYAHPNSPKTFTQPQLFACLVLKRFLKQDYRGIVACLADIPGLCKVIGLVKVPHFTALQKAERRLLKINHVRQLLSSSVHLARTSKKSVKLAAVDSTSLQAGHVSPYFVRRRSREPDLWQTTTYRH